MSKGSNRRPTDEKKFSENYDSIFRKKPEPKDLTQGSLEKVCADIEKMIKDQGEVTNLMPTRAFNWRNFK